MRIGKLCVATFLCGFPALATAQPGVDVRVDVGVDADAYDTSAPGDPVESVDVFYDQLSPYGMWVDEPDVGRVFIPEQTAFVPYTTGHWQYTSLGFVWVSNDPFGWATSHYGRWAFSPSYNRWVWSPDTQWGPAWVEWRQTGSDFGWAPLAPEGYVRVGYQAPIESWHYCGAEHVLDANVTRYYEPRERVVVIHREAKPIEHYSNVSNVRVSVGPGAAVLREHRVTVRPVKVEARTIGRWTPAEAHAQVTRAQEHKATFEVQNQHRIEANVKIHEAHTKVVESHPQIKAQVNARAQIGGHPEAVHPQPARPEPTHVEPKRPEPARPEPTHVEPKRPEPVRPEPTHVEPKRPEPVHTPPPRAPEHVEPKAPAAHPEPAHPAPPVHAEPAHPAPPAHSEPAHPAPPAHSEPAHPAPAPAKGEKHEPEHH